MIRKKSERLQHPHLKEMVNLSYHQQTQKLRHFLLHEKTWFEPKLLTPVLSVVTFLHPFTVLDLVLIHTSHRSSQPKSTILVTVGVGADGERIEFSPWGRDSSEMPGAKVLNIPHITTCDGFVHLRLLTFQYFLYSL